MQTPSESNMMYNEEISKAEECILPFNMLLFIFVPAFFIKKACSREEGF